MSSLFRTCPRASGSFCRIWISPIGSKRTEPSIRTAIQQNLCLISIPVEDRPEPAPRAMRRGSTDRSRAGFRCRRRYSLRQMPGLPHAARALAPRQARGPDGNLADLAGVRHQAALVQTWKRSTDRSSSARSATASDLPGPAGYEPLCTPRAGLIATGGRPTLQPRRVTWRSSR